jgi:hypothetical protein
VPSGHAASSIAGCRTRPVERPDLATRTYNGHRMTSRVGVDPERLAALARMMQISGPVIGALLITGSVVLATMNGGFEWTGFNETRQGQTALTYPAMGLVFGLVFLVSPFTMGFAFRRAAGEQLYLDGAELTIVGPGNREPDVFDLTRTRASVRLDASTGSNAGRAETGTHRPVLVLLRDPDNREFVIELADLRTRRMRSEREILMLEGVLRFAADPATQWAAGQLRTVARWPRLPVIHESSPNAIPASPVGPNPSEPRASRHPSGA